LARFARQERRNIARGGGAAARGDSTNRQGGEMTAVRRMIFKASNGAAIALALIAASQVVAQN
jgi:hypothetical protein